MLALPGRNHRRKRDRQMTSPDVINNPAHYATGFSNGAQVIDITENLNFNRGNAVKYIARAGRKDPTKELEDLGKALFYVTREIRNLGGRTVSDEVRDELEGVRADLLTVVDERDAFRDQLDEARAEIDELKAKPVEPEPESFKPGDKVKTLEGWHSGEAGDVLTVREGGGKVIDGDGDLLVRDSHGGATWIQPGKVRKLRTFHVGDPEPEDKTLTLTGEDEGRTVTLKYGRLSDFQGGGGPLTWWDVTGKWPTNADLSGGFPYWLERFGPLTEV
ncbi:hypothetical protein KDJ57_gp55 [Gordonia phage Catfish]|uniref:DUF3310 domain-containing protein n=1 Tax=Gordonia phage Catfish TaxID=2301538 RepID=A0A385D1P6_9CAUD|nr:hypothetical protein KDJ57_gp55 [Gordonia phage Catfish]AXQ51890.1 hypothetical protein SEA_CATFISH_54 [Gordonia phage Catfish]